jgi:heme/copper-type cytochrome/quinol oxidase subunit 2
MAVAFMAVAFMAVAFMAVAFMAVAFVLVMFCSCAKAVSLPMTDNNPDISAEATNIAAIDIPTLALPFLLLLLLSSPLHGFINANEES